MNSFLHLLKHAFARTSICSFALLITCKSYSQCGISLGPDISVCAGSGTNLTASITSGNPTVFTWSSSPSGTLPSTQTITAAPAVTTSYIVQATGNGCDASDTIVVTVNTDPSAVLNVGSGVDTMTFNDSLTFYKCAAAAQEVSQFTFLNGSSDTNGVTSTIIWGDTGTTFTSSTAWSSVEHIYARGIYSLIYTVTNNTSGCSRTTYYKVFFGSNPAGGIASPGNTDICGPGSLTFVISNYQNNTVGTIYTVAFNDGTPDLVFSQPPPDTITHLFKTSSCGVSSSNGVTTFPNSYAASLTVQNPCGITAGAVLPIYISLPPVASYSGPQTACTNASLLFVNTSKNGVAVSASGCNTSTPILWSISPASGWTLTTGSLGSNNGFVDDDFDPTSWTSGSNTLGVNFTTAGSYTVQIVAANSCGPDTFIEKYCVAAPPAPAFTIAGSNSGCAPVEVSTNNNSPAPDTCSGTVYTWSVVQNSFSCAGPDSNYTYTGGTNSSSSNVSITFKNQGDYSLSLIGNNVCGTYTATQNVMVKVAPEAAVTSPASICENQTISPSATVQVCGGTVSSYAWTFTGGTPSSSTSQDPGTISYHVLGVQTISLTVTNECGSDTAMDTITINPAPVANGGADKGFCSGGSVQLGAAAVSGSTYLWTPSTGLSSSTVSNPTVTLSITDSVPVVYTYYLKVTNSANCSATDTVLVTVYPPATVTVGPALTICDGWEIQLNGAIGGGATSSIWTSSNGGIFTESGSPVSDYTPTITSGTAILTLTTNVPSAYCPAVSASFTLTVDGPPIANPGPDTVVCSGTPLKIGTAHQTGYYYLWSPATGLNFTNVAEPTVTLTNNTNNIITQTYTLEVTNPSGCTGTAQVTVSVYPQPGANAGLPISVCPGGSVNLTGTISGSATGGIWSSTTGIFSQADSLQTVFTPAISSGTATATLTTTPSSGICAAAVSSVNITVNPLPAVTNNPLDQTVCSGTATQPVALTSSVAGTTFSWIGSSPDGVTGFTAFGISSTMPSQTLANTSGSPDSVIYAIFPSANGCSGTASKYTIVIDPLPKLSAIPSQTICSGAASSAVTVASNVAGATFSWVGSANSKITGYVAFGSGNIPAQTLTNSGTSLDSVVYTITPTFDGCTGVTSQFKVYVEPVPQATIPANQTICSGATTSAVNLTSSESPVTFNWTASASSGISGYTASGTGNIPAQTLTNSATAQGTLTYSIITTSGICSGSTQSYTITVKPVPVLTITPASTLICNGTQTDIALSSNIAGTTFSWTYSAQSGITGAGNGTGSAIHQTLSNSSGNTETVTYTIVPSANTCTGEPEPVTITVNPPISIQFSPTTQAICSGQATQLVNISSPSSGVTFTWTSQANGVTGVSASGTNTIPVQTLDNASNNVLTAKYNVTASFTGCASQTATYSISVSPVPVLTLPTGQTVCSGSATSPVAFSSSLTGTTYSWVGSSSDGATGFTVSGTASTIPSQTITNTSTSPDSVIYTITPSAGGCTGATSNYIILINPLPQLSAIPSQTICTGAASSAATVASNVAGATFSWVGSANSKITGYVAFGSGNIPAQTLTNSGTSLDSVVYTITPTFDGCTGVTSQFKVYVEPVPQATIPANQTICSGATTSAVNLTSSESPVTFNWTASASSGISGYTASGTGNIPAQTLTNSASAQGTLTYSIITTSGICSGSTQSYTITVKPVPVLTITPASTLICNGTQTDIALSSNIAGTTFSWTYSAQSGITGAGNGSGSAIHQTLTNSTQNTETVTYVVEPSANICTGQPDSVTITVNPGSTIQFSPTTQTICSGQATQLVSISSGGSGITFTWTSQANGVTGVSASGTNTIPVQTLINSSNSILTVNYIVSASFTGCAGQTSTYPITVNPVPVINLPADQTICAGASTSPVAFSSSVTGTTYSWTGSSPDGATGFTANGTASTIPSQTITNTSNVPDSVIYTVVPATGGCAGATGNYTIIVDPLSQVAAISSQTICSGATSSAVSLSSNVTGSTFNWSATADSKLSGYTFFGASNIPAQSITNSGTSLDSVVYTITPAFNSCNGTTSQFKIYVEPVPQATIPVNQSICSGATTSAVNLTSALNPASFNWTASASPGISGFSASGSGNIPAQTITNSGTSQGSVTYSIITSSGTCSGPAQSYAITVNPVPIVTIIPASATVCNGAETNIILTSNITGTTFSWTANAQSGITGAGNGTGNTIQQTLSNSTQNNETVTYTIEPSADNCAGQPDSVTATINPAIGIQFSPATQTICSGQATQLVNISSPSSGVFFSWISQANGITGVTASGTNTIPVQTLANAGNSVLTANYVVTASLAGCSNQAATYPISVNPLPIVTLPVNQSICSGTVTTAIAFTSSLSGTIYSWTASSANSITGFSASGTSSNIPAQTLNDAGSVAGSVNYVITPQAGGCTGAPVNYTIDVNPGLVITPVSSQSICSGSSTQSVTPAANIQNTTFTWTASSDANLSGYTASGSGTIPAQTIINNGGALDSVTYVLSGTTSGCSGNPVSFVVYVGPTPRVTIPASQVVCSGGSSSQVALSATNGASVNWTASAPSALSGYTASGTGNIPAQTIFNSGGSEDSIIYTVTSSLKSCSGTAENYIIAVTPAAGFSATPASSTICPGVTTDISLSSGSGGTFSWTASGSANITGASSGTGNSIQQTLGNSGTAPGNVTYIVSLSGATCATANDTVVVSVSPGINILFSPAAQNICSGSATQLVNISSSITGVSFSWTSQANGITGVTASGTNTIPVQTLVNASNGTLTANYLVTGSQPGCANQTATYPISVNPVPVVTLPSPQTICTGTASSSVAFTSSLSGTIYSWTASSANSITGFTASGASSNIPAQTLNDAGSVAGSVNYVITPEAGGCTGAPVNYTIDVNPGLVITPVSSQSICSGSSTQSVTPAANIQNTTFTWTGSSDANLSGYTASGSGTIPAQTIINNGGALDSVTYVLSGTTSGCSGNPVSFVVYVGPTPRVTIPASQVVCSGGSSSQVALSATNGASVNWTASAPSALSGYTASGTGNIPAQTIFNSGGMEDSVIYTVTSSLKSCSGTAENYIIAVTPAAGFSATPASSTICPGVTTDISLSSGSGGTFSWTASGSANITGASSGTGNSIQQTLGNSGTAPGNVTYIVSLSGATCATANDTVLVTVNPGIDIQLSSGQQIICSGQSSSLVNISSSVTGTSFFWSAQSNGVTGVTLTGTSSIPAQQLENRSSSVQTVVYTITGSSSSCPAKTTNYEIAVNPLPVITGPAPQTICSGTATTPVALSANLPGSTFAWTTTASTGISGYLSGGSAALIPAQILTNAAQNAGNVTYKITTSSGGCQAFPYDYTVTVNPLPGINPPLAQTVCSGVPTTAIDLSSAIAGTTYAWTATADNGISGYTRSGEGNIPPQTMTNNTNATDSVIYTISPTVSGCTGGLTNLVVHVNPTPQVWVPGEQVICSGDTTSLIIFSSNVSGVSFNWTASSAPNVAGYTLSGTGNVPAQVIYNSGNELDSVLYTIVPVASTCTGQTNNYKTGVRPLEKSAVNPNTNALCSGSTTNIALSSNIAGTTFNWTTYTGADITGPTSGNGNLIQQVLSNNGQRPETVMYIISPVGSLCPVHSDSVVLTINPGINIRLSSGQQTICSGQSTSAVNITSPLNGANFNWTAQANEVTGVANSGTNTIPVQQLENTTNAPQTVTYSITGNFSGCSSPASNYTITVNPLPAVTALPAQSICSGSSTSPVTLSSNITGADLAWTATGGSGISGFTAIGNTASIPAETLTNSGLTAGTVTYSIKVSSAGCTGSPYNYTVTVNPIPAVNTPPAQTICNGASTNVVNLSSDLQGTTFNWVSQASAGITGNTPSGNGNIPAETLDNSGTQTGTVTYTITPVAGNCTGTPINITDSIRPTADLASLPQAQNICSGRSTGKVDLTSPTQGASIQWTAQIPDGITGAIQSGGVSIPTQVLYNNMVDTFPVPLTINYSISISVPASTCPAKSRNYAITVQPKPIIGFQVSVPKGCSPLSVDAAPNTFNYGGADSLVITWGDGTQNTILHPSIVKPEWYSSNHIFYNNSSQPVTYAVSLRASSFCLDTTITDNITVQPSFVNAFFTTNGANGCEPLTVTFQDQSSGVTELNWCFNFDTQNGTCLGGGVVDTAGSLVTHTFTAGTYTVALYASDGFGCAHDTAFQTVVVSPAPTAAFTASTVLCALEPVTFTASDSNPGSFSNQYTWQFGDGTSSSAVNPEHSYDSAGTYNVCLNINSGAGCAGSVCKPVTIDVRPVVDFSTLNACVNQQTGQFSNLSTGTNFYYWQFGDGATSTAISPDHIYLASGAYDVTLVGSNNNCADTAMQTLTIYPKPAAAFTVPALYSCGLPSSVQITNTSTGAVAYEWDLGNNTTSQFENPEVTYSAQGAYIITLVASNQYNCLDTANSSINVYPQPVVQSVSVQAAEGCSPLPVTFVTNAINASQYVWSFGDGATYSSDSDHAYHLYTDTGTYTVQLQVYSYSKCGDTLSLLDTVIVHVNPTAAFDYNIIDSAGLENGTVQFINNSINSNAYTWNFSDGSTSSDVDPRHIFPESNSFNVMLIASNVYGCKDTAYKGVDVIKKSLYVPNALAPEFTGGNNLVQVWKPAGMGLSSYTAQIYDKWGELLWQSSALTEDLEPAEGWDGTYQGKPCQQGVYVWKIEATFIDGTVWAGTNLGEDKINKTIGSVTLIR